MAQKLVNRGGALPSAGLFYKYEAPLGHSSSSDSDSEGSLILPVKRKSYAREVSRSARVMFPEFFVKTTTKGLYEKSSESYSCSAASTVSKGTDIERYGKLDEGIKIWFIKEYGLLTVTF